MTVIAIDLVSKSNLSYGNEKAILRWVNLLEILHFI
jgi:hypothetical protein